MESKSKTPLIVGMLVLVAAVVGIVAFMNRDSSSETATTDTAMTENAGANTDEQSASSQNIVEAASANEEFSTLVAAIKAAGLVETLSGETVYTVFAPVNAAFDKLPAGTVDTLLKPENKEQLSGILTYHVVAGSVTSDQLKDGQSVPTVNGGTLTVKLADGKVYLVDATGGQAQVTKADMRVSNGVIHVIDSVLMPQ